MITLQEFLKKYLGKSKGYPTDNQYQGQCLSIVKLYILEVFGITPPASGSGSAYGYWSNFPSPLGEVFEKVVNSPDVIPQEGWIAIWQPWSSNQYGHISIVAKDSTTGTLKNYAQNWTSKTFQLESNRYTNVIGFLKPIKNLDDDMTEEQKRILDFLKDKSEGDVREAFGALNDLPSIQKKLSDLEVKLSNLDQKYNELNQNYIEKVKSETRWQKAIDTANTKISEQDTKIGELEKKVNDNWGLYDSKRIEFNKLKEDLDKKISEAVKKANKMTPWGHIRYGISLLVKKGK